MPDEKFTRPAPKLWRVDPELAKVGAAWIHAQHDLVVLPQLRRATGPGALLAIANGAKHHVRVFTEGNGIRPVGLVGLSNIDESTKSAELWFLLGDQRYKRLGLTTGAALMLLDHGFEQLDLQVVQSQTVVEHTAAIRILEHLGFRMVGRQRRCHLTSEKICDRLLYDMLAEEHHKRRKYRLVSASRRDTRIYRVRSKAKVSFRRQDGRASPDAR